MRSHVVGCEPSRSCYRGSPAWKWRDEWGLPGGPSVAGAPATSVPAPRASPPDLFPAQPPKLDARRRRQLERLLVHGARARGYLTDLWTCPRVGGVIRTQFGVRYHVDHLGRLLHTLGWSPQKPARRARERDAAASRHGVRVAWAAIKKARRLTASVVFLDASGLLLAPLVRRTGAPRGQTPSWTSAAGAGSRSPSSPPCPSPRGASGWDVPFPPHPNANVTTVWLLAFLRDLERHIRRPAVVIGDRRLSQRARALRHFLAARRRLHAELLPPYAPELHPVETS